MATCKKTHKRVSGECVPNNVVNKKKYASIKKKIKQSDRSFLNKIFFIEFSKFKQYIASYS